MLPLCCVDTNRGFDICCIKLVINKAAKSFLDKVTNGLLKKRDKSEAISKTTQIPRTLM